MRSDKQKLAVSFLLLFLAISGATVAGYGYIHNKGFEHGSRIAFEVIAEECAKQPKAYDVNGARFFCAPLEEPKE